MNSFWTILLQLFKVNESRDNQCGVTPHFSTGQNLFFKKKKNLGEYHDLHVQSNTLLLADVYYIYVILLIDMEKIIKNT